MHAQLSWLDLYSFLAQKLPPKLTLLSEEAQLLYDTWDDSDNESGEEDEDDEAEVNLDADYQPGKLYFTKLRVIIWFLNHVN